MYCFYQLLRDRINVLLFVLFLARIMGQDQQPAVSVVFIKYCGTGSTSCRLHQGLRDRLKAHPFGLSLSARISGQGQRPVCCLCCLQQGLRDRINILLFSLAVADLMNLVTQLLQNLTCFMDSVDSANWNVFMTPQVFYLSRYANFVSGMLIVVMAVDRCLSVTLPMKASRILSFG